MQKLINWCKKEWLLLTSCLFVAFIPLYPKLPLLDVMQTWVYIRVEDLLVAITASVFVLMLWRKKLFPSSPLTIAILVYWGVGLLVLVNAILFIGPKILHFFPHLAILHYARRIEYMFLFFLGYFAFAKKPTLLSAFIWTLTATTIGVIAYGVGQKFLGFPAFLTMNEEFAKGVPLRLPPTARIASTFGGHYDLGAYLVLVIPIFGSLALSMKRIWQRIVMVLVAVGSLVLLLFTASRISFLVYLVAISTMLLWKKKAWLIVPVLVLSFVMLNFVSSASERFYKTFRYSDVIVDLSTGQPIGTLEEVEGGKAKVETQESPATENLPKGSGFIGVGGSDKPGKTVKTIEYIASNALATGSGDIATVSGSFLIQKAFVYDISLTTRFQAEWPMAMEAFRRNYLLGSGFSILSVATDGDYVRMLGETGILGMVSFLSIFIMAFWLYFTHRKQLFGEHEGFVTGVFAGLVGLFLNAILIDVFEASKVAFVTWLILGVAMAQLGVKETGVKGYLEVMKRVFTSSIAYMIYILVGIFIVYQAAMGMYFLGDDFTWLRWAASTQSSALGTYFTDAAGFFYRPLAKLLYFGLYAIFWLKPAAYHVVSLVFFFWITSGLYLFMRRLGVRVGIALLSCALFIVMSIHHEIVFWISTYSHMLSAGFLISALLVFDCVWTKKSKWNVLLWIAGYLLAFASSLSYEGGAVSGVVLAFIGFVLYNNRSVGLLGLVMLTPLYWWVRSVAGAVGPSGNYGVKPTTLLVNVVANAAGYIVATFVGPRAVEWFEALRVNLRQFVVGISVALVLVGGFVMVKIKAAGRSIDAYKKSMWWLVAAVLSMIPFLGLGGMTERYAFVPSMFIVIALSTALETLMGQSFAKLAKKLAVAAVVALIIWNYVELNRVAGDWKKASSVAETAILAIKANFFPLQDKQAFVFVDVPIKYGRAWIFPTGLTDPLWHIFKFNTHPYSLYEVANRQDAFATSSPNGIPFVLEFDDYVLKRVTREIKTVDEATP